HGKRVGTTVGSRIMTGLSYHPLPNRQNTICNRPCGLNRELAARNKTAGFSSRPLGETQISRFRDGWLLLKWCGSPIASSRPFDLQAGCPRHCERSEAIHSSTQEEWIAPSLARLAMTRRNVELLPPHLAGDLDGEAQLGPLLFLREDVAFLGRGEAALRRQRELFERREFRRLVQPAPDVVLPLQLAEFRGDDADHDDLVALGQIAQRLEAT